MATDELYAQTLRELNDLRAKVREFFHSDNQLRTKRADLDATEDDADRANAAETALREAVKEPK